MIKKSIEVNYTKLYNLSENQKRKMLKLFTMLACRFYVENELDSLLIEEMLIKGNLDYCIKSEKERIKLKGRIKKNENI